MNDDLMDSGAAGSAKRPRDEAKWSLDSIGALLVDMRGEMVGLTRDVRDVRRTVESHSDQLDSLQLRITEVEAKQASFSPAPSSFSAASSAQSSRHAPPPGLHKSAPGPSRRDGDEAVVIRPFKEGSLKREINAALLTIINNMEQEVKQLVQESFAPGAVGEIGIIKVTPSVGGNKQNMWKAFHAIKAMDLHALLQSDSARILPAAGRLRPRPSKTPEERIKDREITWTLIALRQVAEKHKIDLSGDNLKLGSAGKVYMDRNLIAVINKETGHVQWKQEKLTVAGFPAVADIEAERTKVKQGPCSLPRPSCAHTAVAPSQGHH